jgi:N-hydroxyarylamine O-acetyltransferase
VRWSSPENSPLGPKEHTLLKVECPEGSYLADVGFGACVLDAPLPFAGGAEMRTRMGTYRLSEIDGLFWLSAKRPAGWRQMYAFDLVPQLQSDIELANWFTSTSPRVPFTSKLIMERVGNDRRYKLIDRRFLIEAANGDVVDERSISGADELAQVLDQVFNVSPPVPVEAIFARFA